MHFRNYDLLFFGKLVFSPLETGRAEGGKEASKKQSKLHAQLSFKEQPKRQ